MSPASNPGKPPVQPSRAVQRAEPEGRGLAESNYLRIVDALKANNSAEAKAIRAMFGGDKRLMDRFLAVAFSALASNSQILRDATPMSLIQAIKDAAALGLEPMTEDAAIVVYSGTAKLMPQWRGYLKRIRNSGKVVEIDCQVVYGEDVFELSLGTSPSITHIPKLPEQLGDKVDLERGGYRGVYAWALMPSGKYLIEWIPAVEIDIIRDTWGNKRSQNNKPLPWETSYGEMARKTAIRRLAKRLPGAAVDQLLTLDAAHDETAETLAAVRDDMADVRKLALQAVQQLPAGDPAPTPTTNGEAKADDKLPETQPAEAGGQDAAKPAAEADEAPSTGTGPHNHPIPKGWVLQPESCPACYRIAQTHK
jgi:recombination protein RecT